MTGHEDWIGRTSRRQEVIGPRLIDHFRATFGAALFEDGDTVPPGLHWCLVPDLSGREDLGRDGHPRHGIFVPKLHLPRRMWAGGELVFETPLRPGDDVIRDSTVDKIAFKTGSTGELGFVTIRHVWSAGGSVAIRERQDLVYREDPKPGQAATPPSGEAWSVLASERFDTDPVLLFRYSALTFNGHRIHYDEPYARSVEGYDGLVVHGPMQAILMLNLVARLRGTVPSTFSYRGLSPLICGVPATIEARVSEYGIETRVITGSGVVTMSGKARWQAA